MGVERSEPARRVTAGIDLASEDHPVAIVDEDGQRVDQFTILHTAAAPGGAAAPCRSGRGGDRKTRWPGGGGADGGGRVSVRDRAEADQIKNLRGRYGSAGNKGDRCDADVLTDALRTDRARLRALQRDSEQTITLRMTLRARQDLVHARVAMGNQRRAHLQSTLPGSLKLFRDIDSPIKLAFLRRFPDQNRADWLSPARLDHWLRSVDYNHRANLSRLWAHLHDAPRGTTGTEGTQRGQVTLALIAALTALNTEITALETLIADQLAAHPDAAVSTSLPRAGTVRAARLLAEIGDARGRFPTPEALTCLAGAAPSTRQSGKVKIVAFRWAVDKQLIGAVIDFAGDS